MTEDEAYNFKCDKYNKGIFQFQLVAAKDKASSFQNKRFIQP